MPHVTASDLTARDLAPSDSLVPRHIGPDAGQITEMLATLNVASLDELVDQTVPASLRAKSPLTFEGMPKRPLGEHELLERLRSTFAGNATMRSLIGMGYHACIVPGVIQRNILENPGWYTAYTPYQAEISQGRLEALLIYQTMICELTGFELANASLLDEATAAAEAMAMCYGVSRGKKRGFFVSEACHPQTIAVVRTRGEAMGLDVRVGNHERIEFAGSDSDLCGVLVQYPNTRGVVVAYDDLARQAHEAGALLVAAADLLALVALRPPSEFGADIAVGSSQRFGVPMGYGGPHAAFLATASEYKRHVPGRIIGVSRDAGEQQAFRMAMQTREQHIRRERATSNICTAQVLLAVMAGFYATYHGPDGLRRIAARVHKLACVLASGLQRLGFEVGKEPIFDTVCVRTGGNTAAKLRKSACDRGINLREYDPGTLCIALDECSTLEEVGELLEVFAAGRPIDTTLEQLASQTSAEFPAPHARKDAPLKHAVFSNYRSEHELLRYLHRLQSRDLSLTTSMIALGSCTMKLNATCELTPLSWPELSEPHPFAPPDQVAGYHTMFAELESWLAEITGMAAVSLQPNAGSQGEYAGLMVIRAYHHERGQAHRNVCLIPVSAHGTNPASAVLAGMKLVTVACDKHGNIDIDDMRAKAEKNRENLAALMVTYPSTHGVFEPGIREICDIVHQHGGQVYLDGANMNAQVGLCRPGDYGADVCHLNLHKTFAIPHGGGGPGMGPIAVARQLAPFLPGHPVIESGGEKGIGAIAAAPFSSASILSISWMYIAALGGRGLTRASQVAILNANYMAARLGEHYPVLYHGMEGRVAHEFILDFRPFKATSGIEVEDVAKRLIDYGFHAPTMSFPVAGTLMIEPTESESKPELDRFCDALISIREEIAAVERGDSDPVDNPLRNAPHTAQAVSSTNWLHAYSREDAAFPAHWLREHKYWPPVARVDNAWGDRHLRCVLP